MIDKIKKFFVESKTKLLISWPNNHIGLILIVNISGCYTILKFQRATRVYPTKSRI